MYRSFVIVFGIFFLLYYYYYFTLKTTRAKLLTRGSNQGCSWMQGENVLPSGAMFLAFNKKRLFQQFFETHE